MDINLKGRSVAMLGGSYPCREILDLLVSDTLKNLEIKILAVADPFHNVEGIQRAKELGIYTTGDYSEVLQRTDIDLFIKIARNTAISESLKESGPLQGQLLDLDNIRAMKFLSDLRMENEIVFHKQKLREHKNDLPALENIFLQFSRRIENISEKRIQHLLTERKDLIEIEKELSQIIHGSMIPTFIINQDHIITHWNKALEELTGYKSYEVVGTDKQWVPFRSAKRPTMADIIVGQLPEEVVTGYYGSSWQKSVLIKEAYEAEEFFPHMGEEGKWIYFTAAPIKTEEGKIIGAIETLRDMTQTKKAQEEIECQDQELSSLYEKYKRSEEKYRTLFNNNPNPIFIIDQKTMEILDMNHRVEIDYGYTKHDLLGSSFFEIGDKEDYSIVQGLKNLEPDKSILFTKKKHYKKGKKPFFVNIKVCHVIYSNRDMMIASVTDITENVEKETQLIQAGKLATLGTMAAGMAHEINQPLNVIQICADLMLKMINKGISIPDDELVSMAKDIVANVARASGVIKHVRDFARQSERDLKKLVINDPINDVFKVLGHQLSVHQVKVDLKLDPDIPQIQAEHNRLEQVFINLVTNAIDSMDEKAKRNKESQIEKTLTIESFAEDNFVVVKVTDTGIGMTREVKEKIFEPFFTTKETGKGTGLGTSISFGIVKDYQGSIDIESEPDKGATFIVRFPVIQ